VFVGRSRRGYPLESREGYVSRLPAASAAVEHFHQQLNAADYDGIYEDASDEFRRSASREDVVGVLEKVHRKMGNSGKTSPAGFHVNWKNGLTTVDQVLETEFAMGRGQESFV
jgi:hypothetical protein